MGRSDSELSICKKLCNQYIRYEGNVTTWFMVMQLPYTAWKKPYRQQVSYMPFRFQTTATEQSEARGDGFDLHAGGHRFASADVHLMWFSSAPPANVRAVPQCTSGTLYKSVPVHCALIIPQFDAKYPDLMTASINKPQIQINKTVSIVRPAPLNSLLNH